MKKKVILLVAILLLQLVPMTYAQGMDSEHDRIWISAGSPDMIYEFTTSWELVSSFKFEPNGRPSGIAIDSVNGPSTTLWVVREVPGKLFNMSKTGNILIEIDTESLFGAYGPEGVDVDPFNGSLWFVTDTTDFGPSTVFNISREGSFISSFPTSSYDETATSPQSIAVDPSDGSLWVTDNRTDEIYHVSNQGENLSSIDTRSFLPNSFNPQGVTIAIDKTDGTLWVTDRDNNVVYNLSRNGDPIMSIDLDTIFGDGSIDPDPTGIAYERIAYDLGEANDFTVFGLAGTSILMDNSYPSVVGNVGLGPYGVQDLKAGSIAGTLFLDPTVENKVPGTVVDALITDRDLYPAVTDALHASSDAANLTPTLSFQSIKNTSTIERTGPLTIIDVGSIKLNGNTLTLNGALGDKFIINVSDGMKVENGGAIELTGGLQAGNVLFNFVKLDATVKISNNSRVTGTILAPQIDATVKIEGPGSYVMGAVMAGKSIAIKEDAMVISP